MPLGGAVQRVTRPISSPPFLPGPLAEIRSALQGWYAAALQMDPPLEKSPHPERIGWTSVFLRTATASYTWPREYHK